VFVSEVLFRLLLDLDTKTVDLILKQIKFIGHTEAI
ncbi:uncharacterized protein METZ01_LOCUS159917, partial [marine metagenome]